MYALRTLAVGGKGIPADMQGRVSQKRHFCFGHGNVLFIADTITLSLAYNFLHANARCLGTLLRNRKFGSPR